MAWVSEGQASLVREGGENECVCVPQEEGPKQPRISVFQLTEVKFREQEDQSCSLCKGNVALLCKG